MYLVDTFDMLAKFLKQNGHMERAIALYQAMIEFNLFCPDVLKHAEKASKYLHHVVVNELDLCK